MASQTTLEKKIVELENSKQIPQSSRPKIQRVPHNLRNRKNFEKYYSPKFLSIGPIHHGNTDLKLGGKYKLMWAAKYIENTRLNPRDLHKKIFDNIDELKGHFDDDVILTLTGKSLEGFGSLEEKLSWILFVDGCSLLYILDGCCTWMDDPEPMDIKVDQLVLVMMDVLLLENQLPYQVLKLLWKDEDKSGLIESIMNFFKYILARPGESQSEKEIHVVLNGGEHIVSILNESQLETPTHLLDLLRKITLIGSKPKTKSNEAITSKEASEETGPQKLIKKLLQKIKKWSQKKKEFKLITYRNIQDLKAVGIRVKSSKTRWLRDLDFSAGWFAAKLTLPEIVVDDTSATIFLNKIAYEMCPDFKNDYGICSFAAFIESLIDHPEDVRELRSKGILLNCFGSDEEVANIFNIITTDVMTNINTYHELRRKINEHYCNKYKTWIAQGFHTYFSSPWAITAFLAAFIAIVLTFIQTWFTIHPAC
ncbi:DUF247 domain protein [Medicago truncatula]|nr:DUF247 domain protein [Medicago truncatula]